MTPLEERAKRYAATKKRLVLWSRKDVANAYIESAYEEDKILREIEEWRNQRHREDLILLRDYIINLIDSLLRIYESNGILEWKNEKTDLRGLLQGHLGDDDIRYAIDLQRRIKEGKEEKK